MYTNYDGKTRFYKVKSPRIDEFNALAHTISHRVASLLERKGLLEWAQETVECHPVLHCTPNDGESSQAWFVAILLKATFEKS